MHFVASIMILFLIIIIVFLYAACIYYVILLLYRLLLLIVNRKVFVKNWKNIQFNLKLNVTKKVLVCVIVFITSMSVFIYKDQRAKWMGLGSEHLSAKEYWVAGQVLYNPKVAKKSSTNLLNKMEKPLE